MPLAFLIMAHKHPEQLARLFSAIHRPEDYLLLHIDRRAPAEMHDMARALAQGHRNVVVLKPLKIVWGGFAAAEVQLIAMERALAAHPHWSHFINLSGQDFPLKRLDELDAALAEHPQRNYVPWFDPLGDGRWRNARERVDRFYLDWPWLNRVLRWPGIGRRLRSLFGFNNLLPFVPGVHRGEPPFRYYGGSNYVVLSRAAAKYIVHNPAARKITRWLRHTLHPDEILVQSVLLNSPLARTVVNTGLHAIDFPPHSPHPRIGQPHQRMPPVKNLQQTLRAVYPNITAAHMNRLMQ